MKILVLALALALACGEKDAEDTSAASDGGAAADGGATTDGGVEGVDCSALSVDECAKEGACFSPVGWPVLTTDDGWCVDYSAPPRPQGCIEVKDCGAAEQPATTEDHPEECLWYFSAICLPDGWIPCTVGYLPDCE